MVTPGYAVKYQHVAITGGADLEIRSLLDRQQYDDPLGEAAAAGISPASWPLFGMLWPSARALADLMQGYPIEHRRILEVGCGLALASMVVQRRLGDITASDCHPLTETFLKANLLLNHLPHLNYRTGNWQNKAADLGRFDLIIGSDVLYERDQPEQLACFIQNHAAPHAEVLIIDPNRSNRQAFHRDMARSGFMLNESRIDTEKTLLRDGYRGRLLHYLR